MYDTNSQQSDLFTNMNVTVTPTRSRKHPLTADDVILLSGTRRTWGKLGNSVARIFGPSTDKSSYHALKPAFSCIALCRVSHIHPHIGRAGIGSETMCGSSSDPSPSGVYRGRDDAFNKRAVVVIQPSESERPARLCTALSLCRDNPFRFYWVANHHGNNLIRRRDMFGS
jgi:hypothetical protein